jgi:hypothetical protein
MDVGQMDYPEAIEGGRQIRKTDSVMGNFNFLARGKMLVGRGE